MTRLFLLAALVAAPLASAQNTNSTRSGSMNQADLERLGVDLDRLDRSTTADYDALRQSYDELRSVTPSTDMSDPAAARQARMDYDRRYDELSGNVYRARLSSARNRADYIRAANDRVQMYDDQIRAMRTRYDASTGDDRARMSQDLIRLRAQRDAYRDRVFSTRGMTRSRFDDATRRQATDALTRADADFNRARRDAMTRSANGGTMDGDSM